MGLDSLKPPAGARHSRKRVGRGHGSGLGKTAGKGHKGQNARSGGGVRRGFEGGQMPINRRLPKRGFTPRNRVEVSAINLADLSRFEAGTIVDIATLRGAGLIAKNATIVKLLAEGDVDRALTIRTHRISAAARAKIEAAGGTVELL